jgi:hypothetical protein
MLFDLQGRRRRVVQATYLTLAVLMGGGLVLFGIGSDVSGGLSEVFKGGEGGGGGNDVIEKRIDRNEEALQRNPRSEAARKRLVRDYYQLAVAQTSGDSTGFPEDARDDLAKAAANWRAYLGLEPERPDPSLAGVALQIFDPAALNRPKEAQEAASVVAEARNNSNAYLNLVQYARLAGDTRTADLAGEKAVDLAPRGEKKTVRDQLKQLEAAQAAGGAQGGAAGGAQGGAPQP